jgi:hypothetical protein
MVKNCKHCGKDISDLKPTQKGNHITNCKLNPNLKTNEEKRIETRLKNQRIKNPMIKLKLKCLYCDKEYEINVIESYYNRGKYKKCCCKKCSSNYSHTYVDITKRKIKKCKECGKEIEVNIICSDNICCDECRKAPRKSDNLEKANSIRKRKVKIVKNKKFVCKFCGEEKCERPDVCRKFTHKNVYEKYLGFDINKKGTDDFYNEFDRIVNRLKEDYFENELSFPDIGKKYNMNYQTIYSIFKSLKIQVRTTSESILNAIKNGKNTQDNFNSYPYKSGYHINWKGEEVHYRSNYEKEYYIILDEKRINYEVEKLRILYYDTQKKKRRIAIPDIHIKDTNEIIEIKSKWTLDEINMKDKVKAYKKLGYSVKLMIGEGNKNFFKNVKEIVY